MSTIEQPLLKDSPIHCDECGETMFETPVVLELSNTLARYFKPGEIPEGEGSQGCFYFCHECANRLVKWSA